MNKIELRKVEATGTGTLHIKIFFNDKDVGFIYLNDNEVDAFIKCLKRGAANADVDLITSIYDDIYDDEDVDEDT